MRTRADLDAQASASAAASADRPRSGSGIVMIQASSPSGPEPLPTIVDPSAETPVAPERIQPGTVVFREQVVDGPNSFLLRPDEGAMRRGSTALDRADDQRAVVRDVARRVDRIAAVAESDEAAGRGPPERFAALEAASLRLSVPRRPSKSTPDADQRFACVASQATMIDPSADADPARSIAIIDRTHEAVVAAASGTLGRTGTGREGRRARPRLQRLA
jgi:hypothetical protein